MLKPIQQLMCQKTIGDQLLKWLKMGAINLVSTKLDFLKNFNVNSNFPHTLLPLSVERTKPRCCLDGGCIKCISPDKIPCKLDCITEALKSSKENCYYVKYDDSNGFMHIFLNQWSQRYCGIQFGNLVFQATALPFGLTQSPGRFQALNNVAVNFLNLHGRFAKYPSTPAIPM